MNIRFTGPLAVIAFAFIACKNWTEMGWDLEDNPVATAFEIFWMFFEPMLFSVTGAQVVVSFPKPKFWEIYYGGLYTTPFMENVDAGRIT